MIFGSPRAAACKPKREGDDYKQSLEEKVGVGCFPGLAVPLDFNMFGCLSLGQSLLEESEENEKRCFIATHPQMKSTVGIEALENCVCQIKRVLISVLSALLMIYILLEAYRYI